MSQSVASMVDTTHVALSTLLADFCLMTEDIRYLTHQ